MGRSTSCGLRLSAPLASGEHATLWWSGLRWELRDLGSRNGTFLDGRRLAPGSSYPLSTGACLGFGNAEPELELVADDPPSLVATDLAHGGLVDARDGILLLPCEEVPELAIFSHPELGWALEEADGRLRAAHDGEVVAAGGRPFRLQLPVAAEGTPYSGHELAFASVSLRFRVSRDQEIVRVSILDRGHEIALEPREHGYLLLVLARARAEDRALPTEERGWRHRQELEQMLKIDENALNVAIHRARRQLAAAGLSNASMVVEVGRARRRLGTDRFQIIEGA